MNKVEIFSLFFNRMDKRSLKPKQIAQEFESLLLEEYLKTGIEPLMENKSFTQKMYWEQFITTVAEKMAERDPLKFEKVFQAYLKGKNLK